MGGPQAVCPLDGKIAAARRLTPAGFFVRTGTFSLQGCFVTPGSFFIGRAGDQDVPSFIMVGPRSLDRTRGPSHHKARWLTLAGFSASMRRHSSSHACHNEPGGFQYPHAARRTCDMPRCGIFAMSLPGSR